MDVFFNDPSPAGGGFHLRELGRLAGVAPPSVKRYLLELEKEGLILRVTHRTYGYPLYSANREGETFRFLKRVRMVELLWSSGLISYLWDVCMPDAIILYGSASRGEDVQGSDIDVVVLSKEKKLELAGFEKALQRGIAVFFQEGFSRLSPELKNNVINGIILKGYLKVF